LRAVGLPAVGLLRQSLQHEDPEIAKACERALDAIEKVPTDVVAAAAARMIGRLRPPGLAETILAQMPSVGDEEVGDAFRWPLAQVAVETGPPRDTRVAAWGDSAPPRRGGGGGPLIGGGAKTTFPAVRKLLDDPDPTVRLRTSLALVSSAKDKQAIP